MIEKVLEGLLWFPMLWWGAVTEVAKTMALAHWNIFTWEVWEWQWTLVVVGYGVAMSALGKAKAPWWTQAIIALLILMWFLTYAWC